MALNGLRRDKKSNIGEQAHYVMLSGMGKSVSEIATHYWFSKQGLHACHNTIVKSLNKLGYVYKCFSEMLPENAPTSAQKKVRIREIVGEISKSSATDVEIMFLDESHFSNQPYVNHGWFT